jgi:hypothetical protein
LSNASAAEPVKRHIYTAPPRRWDPLDRQPREMERDSDLDLEKGVWGLSWPARLFARRLGLERTPKRASKPCAVPWRWCALDRRVWRQRRARPAICQEAPRHSLRGLRRSSAGAGAALDLVRQRAAARLMWSERRARAFAHLKLTTRTHEAHTTQHHAHLGQHDCRLVDERRGVSDPAPTARDA